VRINISNLDRDVGDSVEFALKENFPPLDFMGEEIVFPEPLHIDGIIMYTNIGYLVKGRVTGSIRRLCGRCSELYEENFDSEFDAIFRRADENPQELGHEEGEIEEGMEFFTFTDAWIDLSDIVQECIITEIPMKALCREDCLGLCPVCGQNRNIEACTCENNQVDERLAGLKAWKHEDDSI